MRHFIKEKAWKELQEKTLAYYYTFYANETPWDFPSWDKWCQRRFAQEFFEIQPRR